MTNISINGYSNEFRSQELIEVLEKLEIPEEQPASFFQTASKVQAFAERLFELGVVVSLGSILAIVLGSHLEAGWTTVLILTSLVPVLGAGLYRSDVKDREY